jgi:hypothetical protein
MRRKPSTYAAPVTKYNVECVTCKKCVKAERKKETNRRTVQQILIMYSAWKKKTVNTKKMLRKKGRR